MTSGHSYRWTLRARKTGAPWIYSEETGCRQFTVLPAATAVPANYSPGILSTVFPNPFSSSATISSPLKNCGIKIFDVVGNVIRSFANVDQFPFTIEREKIASGIYMLEFRSECPALADGAYRTQKVERIKLLIE